MVYFVFIFVQEAEELEQEEIVQCNNCSGRQTIATGMLANRLDTSLVISREFLFPPSSNDSQVSSNSYTY